MYYSSVRTWALFSSRVDAVDGAEENVSQIVSFTKWKFVILDYKNVYPLSICIFLFVNICLCFQDILPTNHVHFKHLLFFVRLAYTVSHEAQANKKRKGLERKGFEPNDFETIINHIIHIIIINLIFNK